MSTSRSTHASSRLEPTRITLARQRAGLTKAALAKALSVTPRTISAYERQGAPANCSIDLAAALGCSEQFFQLGAVEALESERVFFRARRRASATQCHAATAAGKIGIELYEWIDERYQLPQSDLPDLDNQNPVDVAESLRAMWGLGWDPLPNLVQLAESHGVRVMALPKGAEEVDAFSVWSDGRPYVFLSLAKTPERSRFDLAHELGHLVMHSRNSVADADSNVEREADRFASAFLMPPQALRTGIRREPAVPEIIGAKSHFKVSAMALNYALHEVQRLGDWGYRQNCIRLAQMGYRSSEPDGMAHHESSRVFRVVFDDLRKTHSLSTDDVAAQVGLLASEVHTLTFGMALYGMRTGGRSVEVATSTAPSFSSERQHLRLVQG